jgi:hypothetical protein
MGYSFNWKLYYTNINPKTLEIGDIITQLNTGLSESYKEISPSIYKNNNNKIVITFIAGNENLEINYQSYQIISSSVEDLSGGVANMVEFFDDIDNYTSIFDGKKLQGCTGKLNNGDFKCYIKDKTKDIKYSLKLSPILSNDFSIVSVSSLPKKDYEFLILIKDLWGYKTLKYDIQTKVISEVIEVSSNLYNSSISDGILATAKDNTTKNLNKEIDISNNIQYTIFNQELITLEQI